MRTLSLFPARVPIGRAQLPDGSQVDVLMTPEFVRAIAALFDRVGGPNGTSNDDLSTLVYQALMPDQVQAPEPFPADALVDHSAQITALSRQVDEIAILRAQAAVPDQAAQIAALGQQVKELRLLVSALAGSAAELAELRKRADDIEQVATQPEQVRVNWERPGNIGSLTPATGSFTRINATTGTVGLPSIYLSTENTTGLYRIGANNWGYAISGAKVIDYGATRIDYSIDSMAVLTKSFYCYSDQFGMGTPDSSGLQIFCGTADVMRFGHRGSGPGFVFTEDMRIDASGDVQVYTKFGCNSKTPQGAYALGAASTDLPTVIVLANNIRLALIANGIGS